MIFFLYFFCAGIFFGNNCPLPPPPTPPPQKENGPSLNKPTTLATDKQWEQLRLKAKSHPGKETSGYSF